jgi:16S rRNA (guanine966-N2)-methyltransferase
MRKQSRGPGSVRIIAGNWRGSKLPVADVPGLRPSGDRCRETLFNWLQPHIRGAVCIDLFAGSGALGMEAASRGAGRVVLVEKNAQAVRVLQENVDRLKGDRVEVILDDALRWLEQQPSQSIDIAFIDPPFGLQLESRALELLQRNDLVKRGGFVYVETARSEAMPPPGPGWELVREKILGEVRMQLLKKV